jgi:hypothetical protein
MLMKKKLLAPERVRQLPSQFSWIDQQLVRSGYLQDCEHSAWALYLFLVTVADAQGLSYYSEAALCRWLKLGPERLAAMRQQLILAGLLAYQRPLYQLLALPKSVALTAEPRSGQVRSVGELLRQIAGGAA